MGPEADFLHWRPPPPLIFLPDKRSFRVVSRLRRRRWRRLLLRMLRKTGALETLEVRGMEEEVGLWEAVPSRPRRDLGMGDQLGEMLFLGKVLPKNHHRTPYFWIVKSVHSEGLEH